MDGPREGGNALFEVAVWDFGCQARSYRCSLLCCCPGMAPRLESRPLPFLLMLIPPPLQANAAGCAVQMFMMLFLVAAVGIAVGGPLAYVRKQRAAARTAAEDGGPVYISLSQAFRGRRGTKREQQE